MVTLPVSLTHAVAADFALGLQVAVQKESSDVVADATALTDFDSAALAVLLECRRHALAAGKAFAVKGLPARLRQLAALYGVAELLPATLAG